jgi:hypothetical protein
VTRSKSLKAHSDSRSLICRDSADWLMRRRNAAFETVQVGHGDEGAQAL